MTLDVDTLIARAGGVGKLAQALGVRHPTVCDWRKAGFIPGSRATQISETLHLPIEDVVRLIKPVSQTPVPTTKGLMVS